MGYGHAEKLARWLRKADDGAVSPWYSGLEARKALDARDITTVYRILKQDGVPHREIAQRTGQRQSEVCEILQGRQVRDVTVLERIADGLEVPRPFLRLLTHAPGEDGTYPEEVTVTEPPEGATEEMHRRAVLFAAPVALWGAPLLGEVPELPAPPWVPEPLPSRLGMSDVARIEHQTGFLRALARQHGGHADAARAIVTHSTGLMAVSADDRVKARLGAALARQHTLAGWCCADSLLDHHAWHHFRQALELAGRVGDSFEPVNTLRVAGNADRIRGHPNDALKLYQFALTKLRELPRDTPRTAVSASWLHVQSARALATMGIEDHARSSLAEAHDGWEPPHDFDRADFGHQVASVHLDLGRLDIAEPFAAAAVQTSGRAGPHVAGAMASVTLATIHVKAGEPDGIPLAKTAIDRVATLRSPRFRQRLTLLVAALEARPGSDAEELARQARQVAASAA